MAACRAFNTRQVCLPHVPLQQRLLERVPAPFARSRPPGRYDARCDASRCRRRASDAQEARQLAARLKHFECCRKCQPTLLWALKTIRQSRCGAIKRLNFFQTHLVGRGCKATARPGGPICVSGHPAVPSRRSKRNCRPSSPNPCCAKMDSSSECRRRGQGSPFCFTSTI